MTEHIPNPRVAEHSVFGNAFSLIHGPASQAEQQRYLNERTEQLTAGIQTWIAHGFDVNRPVVADLYMVGKKLAATLKFDCELGLTDVYVTSDGSNGILELYCESVPFEEAVRDASLYVASLKEIKRCN